MAFLLLAVAIGGSANVNAVSIMENVDGDLSGVAGAPTSVTLELGSNTITGSKGGGDFDFLHVNVPVGLELSRINVSAYGGPSVSFIGVQNGAVWTETTGGGINAANLLGWTLYGNAQLATDILDDISGGAGATGFTPPLASSDYTFLLQETGSAVTYSLDFVAASVPEPEVYALVTGVGLFLGVGVYRFRVRVA